MIRHMVFDMGNVLLRFSPRDLALREGVRPQWVEAFVREVFGNVEWVRLDRGTITHEEAAASVCARLPEVLHGPARRLIFGWWHTPFDIIPGMEDLIRELKHMGYGIWLLSNASSNLHFYFERLPAWDCFDGLLVSADWKMLKPHRDIYETFFREHHLDPATCLFIDDSPVNVEGAAQTGMEGIVFLDSADRLRRDLAARGIPVRQPPSPGTASAWDFPL